MKPIFTSTKSCQFIRPLLTFTRSPYSNISSTIKPAVHLVAAIRHQNIGVTLSLAKKALIETGNDYQKAMAWLDENAALSGTNMAESLAHRVTKQGLVALFKSPCASTCTMIQINCETDFVARTDLFKNLALQIASTTASRFADHPKQGTAPSIQSVSCEAIRQSTLASPDLKSFSSTDHEVGITETVSREIILNISKLGENISLHRAAFVSIKNNQDSYKIGSYMHGNKDQRLAGIGTIGAMVLITTKGAATCEHSVLANQIAKIIVGYNPCTNHELMYTTYPSHYSSVFDFLKDSKSDNLTVGQVLDCAKCKVNDFVRFQIGTN